MSGEIINRDLVRWSRRQWVWGVLLLAVAQFAALSYLSRPLNLHQVFGPRTSLALPAGAGPAAGSPAAEWLQLQDPMLFAAPNWHGVSALAWMRKPKVELTVSREFPPVAFLDFGEARQLGHPLVDPPAQPVSRARHERPAPQISLPVVPPPRPEERSALAYEGFGGRAPVALPELPAEYHNDYVSRSVVEAGIGPAGAVLSARLIGASGSKQADADALALARRMRFEPAGLFRGGAEEIAWGKLIFEWHALNLSPTNTVRR